MSTPLTTLFVLPSGNTLPTTGSTDALTAGQFGVYRNDYSVATTGNIGASPYIYLAQGRIEVVPGLGSKRSDKIYVNNLIEWYKVPAISTSQVQVTAIGNQGVTAATPGVITTVGNVITAISVASGGHGYTTAPSVNISGAGTLASATANLTGGVVTSITVNNGGSGYTGTPTYTFGAGVTDSSTISGPKCDEQWSLTVRLFSSYIDLAYFNGLTRSFTYVTECCDNCGTGDCGSANLANLVAYFVAAVNNDPVISQFITASAVTGTYYGILLTGKALNVYGQPCDITAFPYEYDKLKFNTFFYKGAATSQDFLVQDACTVNLQNVIQTSSYPTGSGLEILELEKRFNSYQTTYKHIFKWAVFNGAFTSYVNQSLFYDTYYIKFRDSSAQDWGSYVRENETCIIAIPTGQSSSIETLLSTFLGSITNYS